ncbi:MAG: dTDP-4-dehydrorhamnose 3,5-epimerase [Panacagrimonas sp.]
MSTARCRRSQPVKITESPLPGVFVIEPRVHGDARGFFVETFRESLLAPAGLETHFVQDNQSRSARGILRGLHYQLEQPQAKLVRVSSGRVFDVAVDIRRGSPHFGRWFGMELDDVRQQMMYVPKGFAHGFLVMSAEADFIYKCSDYYHPASERGLAWNDRDIGIAWPDLGHPPLLSSKDSDLPGLAQATDLPVFMR